MSDVQKKREQLIKELAETKKAHEDKKAEYKKFCQENPIQSVKQPTIHELRKMREKLGEKTDNTHAKVNEASAKKLEREKTIRAAKAKD